MELVSNEIKVAHRSDTYRIHHLTDTHIDDHDHAAKELQARIDQIAADPNALWIGGGDYYSLILPDDKRFATPVDAPVHRLPDVYIEGVVERFAPIADKCLGFGTGNHEATIGKNYHRGVGAEAAMQLGIPEKYLGVRGWVILKFSYHTRRMVVKAYQYHGWSAGRLKGRKALQAERDVGAWRADAFFLGHDHQPYADVFWTQECYDTKKGYRLRNRPVAVINGGSWTYGQRAPATAMTKKVRKPSEWPNEAWVEGRNFRPQSPVSPVLEIHLNFGDSNSETGNEYPAGFEFEVRQRAGMFDV
jgi:hypothetical protein